MFVGNTFSGIVGYVINGVLTRPFSIWNASPVCLGSSLHSEDVRVRRVLVNVIKNVRFKVIWSSIKLNF